ncbi:MAG: hypothetical protein KAS72_12370 [Phycisphaerales bacterium]|nr:hypothetical protein [Phycisphaerales bacterium]
MTPVDSSADGTAGLIGYLNSATDNNDQSRIGVKIGAFPLQFEINGTYDAGGPIENGVIQPIQMGHTYFVAVHIDGPQHTVIADVYEGTDADGTYIGSASNNIDPAFPLNVNSIGFTAPAGSGNPSITADVDDLHWQSDLPIGSFTETFDDGVGRLNTTTGDGDQLIVYDSSSHRLLGTFIRRDSDDVMEHDARLSHLGNSYALDGRFQFSFDWTPLSQVGDYARPAVGLLDNTLYPAAEIWIAHTDAPFVRGYGIVAPDYSRRDTADLGFPGWEFGETYRVICTLDATNETVEFEHYRLVDEEFAFEYNFEFSYSGNDSIARDVTWFGTYNSLDEDDHIGNQLTIGLDNMRFNQPCPWDLTGDWIINQADLGVLLAWYGIGDGGDVDGDGDTDQSDLGGLLSYYGEQCP